MEASSFEWKQVKLGVWSRAIDEAEHFYAALVHQYASCGRMMFAITGHVSVSTPVPVGSTPLDAGTRLDTALREAWLHVRYDYPTIASRVHLDENGAPKKTYEAFPEGDTASAAQEAWLERTFKLVETSFSGDEWCERDPPAPEFPTLFVLASAGHAHGASIRRDVVLRASHDTLDGMGALMLFDRLLQHASTILESPTPVSRPAFGSEHTRLSPPLRVAVQIPSELTEDEDSRLQAKLQLNQSVWATKELALLRFKIGKVVPGVHHRASLVLTKEETSAVIKRAKMMGLTPTHAFHAAMAMATRDIQSRTSEPREVRFINYLVFSERAQCVEPYNCTEHAVAVYHSLGEDVLVVDLQVPAVNNEPSLASQIEEFKSIAETVKSVYANTRQDTEHIKRIACSWKALCAPFVAESPSAPPPPQPFSYASLSSVGRIDSVLSTQYGPLTVQRPWVTSERLDNFLGVFLSAFDGQLELSSTWNDAWHTKTDVDSFLERCKSIVLRSLQVETLDGDNGHEIPSSPSAERCIRRRLHK
ncbi:hypothetical protein Poli38472_013284 [Pythium oligandrum]|uniref:Uncharacterized protein n=1 Tax=Pythium oligandrum TaxID=41045 RepID=A0A8K1FE06_PYTOL|nr:hypothetical protein Poli38472_013284 [Pythium oligandrum]|eukprot:TMW55393.1 hypothetical protein Poli38472_013284 [Pythium oligandrum]